MSPLTSGRLKGELKESPLGCSHRVFGNVLPFLPRNQSGHIDQKGEKGPQGMLLLNPTTKEHCYSLVYYFVVYFCWFNGSLVVLNGFCSTFVAFGQPS